MNVFAYTGLDICWFIATNPYGWPYFVLSCRVFMIFTLFFAGKYLSYTDFIEGSVTSVFKGLRKTWSKSARKEKNLIVEDLEAPVEPPNELGIHPNKTKIAKLKALLDKNAKELQKTRFSVSIKVLAKQTNEAIELTKTINFDDPV
jgi:hypothetical protein